MDRLSIRAVENNAVPGHEDAPPPEDVGEPAAQEQEAAEGERVGADNPLQVLLMAVPAQNRCGG